MNISKTTIPWTRLNFKTLKRGQMIRNINGQTFIVHEIFGNRAVAVRTVDIMNEPEWEVYNPPQS